jgi:hypothetical protein
MSDIRKLAEAFAQLQSLQHQVCMAGSVEKRREALINGRDNRMLHVKAMNEKKELEQEIQRLRKALEHYADEEEWTGRPDDHWNLHFNSRDVDGDGWSVAQRALESGGPK